MKILHSSVAAAALLLSSSFSAQAKIVSFDYSGTIEDTQANALFTAGTPFSGTISYDTNFLPLDSSSTTASYESIPGLFSISIGAFNTSLTSFNAFVRNDDVGSDDDVYVFSSPLPGADGNSSPYSWNIFFADSSKLQITSTALPEAIPSAASHYTSFNISGTAKDSTSFGSTSLAVSAVPEPATWLMMILGFASAGLALRKRRRTAISRLGYAL